MPLSVKLLQKIRRVEKGELSSLKAWLAHDTWYFMLPRQRLVTTLKTAEVISQNSSIFFRSCSFRHSPIPNSKICYKNCTKVRS